MPLDLPDVPPLDAVAAAESAEVRQYLPVGALGVWASVIDLLAAAAGSATGPLAPRRPQLVVFAADHEIAAIGISAALPEETRDDRDRRSSSVSVTTYFFMAFSPVSP